MGKWLGYTVELCFDGQWFNIDQWHRSASGKLKHRYLHTAPERDILSSPAEIDEVVKRIKGLYDLAYTQYSHAVDEVISGRLTDEKQIEHILDGIIDFGDDLRFLELSKRLCRHIYYENPQLVGSFVHMFRALFEEKEDEDGIGDD